MSLIFNQKRVDEEEFEDFILKTCRKNDEESREKKRILQFDEVQYEYITE